MNKDLFSAEKLTVISIVSTGSDTASNTSTENSKQKLTKKKSKIRARFSGCCFLRKPVFWTDLPPIGIAFQLLAAFLLLVSEVSGFLFEFYLSKIIYTNKKIEKYTVLDRTRL